MASYDLRCGECGRDFEVFVQGFLKDEAKVCPDCGSTSVDQRFTGFMMSSGVGSSGTGGSSPSLGCGHSGFG